MPNYKYEAFRQQVYKEFLQDKTVQDVIAEHNLSSKPDLKQNLPTRNIIYAWYKDYLQQNGQDLQSKSDLQSVNVQNADQNINPNQTGEQQSWFEKEVGLSHSVKEEGREVTRNSEGDNDGLIIGGITLGGLILFLLML